MGRLRAPAAPTSPHFYTVKEVAGMLRVSVHTVYRAIDDGELAALRFRGRVIVPARAVRSLIQLAQSDHSVPLTPGTADSDLRPGVAS